MMLLEEMFMGRAFELARKGMGLVSPNPMVGCVIVHDEKIIGEGYHHRYGGPHAEVEAVNSVIDKTLLKEATAFVTLEPCSFHGNTPPCCDLMIKHKFRRVVIANEDPHPKVKGVGVQKMREAGILVETGLLAELGRELNRRLFTFHLKDRPLIILKWAQTSDGFIARENYDSKWISNERSRQLVHKWRAEEDAILVGKNTVLYDDPRLTTRSWEGHDPRRLIVDHRRAIGDNYHVVSNEEAALRFVEEQYAQHGDISLPKKDFYLEMMKVLKEKKVRSVIVEGGLQTLQAFIDLGLWDEARVFVSPGRFEKGIAAPVLQGHLVSESRVGADKLYRYENQEA